VSRELPKSLTSKEVSYIQNHIRNYIVSTTRNSALPLIMRA